MTDVLHYDASDSVALLRLERPPVNALSLALIDDVLDALRRAAADPAVRSVIVQSALPARFCAGLDLDLLLGKSADEVRLFVDKLYVELWETQCAMGKPTIAAVNGAARGGGMTLAISCDVVLASDASSFGYPEIDIGLLPAIHFSHLHRVVGRQRAFELLFSGRTFDAAEAYQLGLVSRVLPTAELEQGAAELASTFAGKSPATMALGRSAFIRATDGGFRSNLADAVEDFARAAESADAQEGLTAFLEKRRPDWSDNP